MAIRNRKAFIRRIAAIGVISLLSIFAALIIIANNYVEPVLRKRLNTLIVEGSDSLYSYTLGGLNADLFGGNIEVNNLQVTLDSSKFNRLKEAGDLPALTLQLNITRARIKGISVLALLFSKKILITEISSTQADVNLMRYPRKPDTTQHAVKEPLWKAIQKKIKDVEVGEIKLDGIKLLYANDEGIDAARLQFNRCDAHFEDIRVDSASVVDTARIGYVKNFSLRFTDVLFRTPDSTYKMNASFINYTSKERLLQIDSFALQPTLPQEQRVDSLQKSWYTVSFDKVLFKGLRLDRFLRLNRAEGDSLELVNPVLSIFHNNVGLKSYKSKIGDYPHQKLLAANAIIDIKKIIAHNMSINVTERDDVTGLEGTIPLSHLNVSIGNIVNDPALIRQNPVSTADASGQIFSSPIQARFRFYLDSAEGKFDLQGSLQNMTAAQINPVSTALANVEVASVQISKLDFFVRGEDFTATSNVRMQYNHLGIVFHKRDEITGENSTRTFITKLLNRYAIYTENPTAGVERKAENVRVARLTTQAFFGVIWQAVFAGMQNIMLKGG